MSSASSGIPMRARARDLAWALYVRPKGRVGNALQGGAILGIEKLRTRRLWDRSTRILLVHTPGKVGSKAITAALAPSLADTDAVFHTHRLNADYLRRSRPARRGLAPRRTWATADYLSTALQRPHSKQIVVLAAVRDPVERNLSAFFQNLERYTDDGLPPRSDELDADDLHHRFRDRFGHLEYANWFHEELGEVFGVDLGEKPFPHARGFQVVRRGQVTVGVIRHDRLEELPMFIHTVGGVDVQSARRVNDSAGKGYGTVYAQVRERLTLPRALLEDLYESEAMRHFYTADERRAAIARWS